MPRIPKRLLALSGLIAGGGAAASALRKRRASRPSAPAPSAAAPAPAAPPPPSPTPPTVTTPGATAPVSDTPVPIAPPPVETPGPSVTPPREPASETEHEERADATTPDPEILSERAGGPVDELVERETAAAAAEARHIGGPQPGDNVADDPAMSPVYEAGGGEAEGFEQAEADLVENATHGTGGANPLRDAFRPELESDEATAIDGEPDEEKVSEVVEDPAEPDGPSSGPGITHER